jgi:hypothetical protein
MFFPSAAPPLPPAPHFITPEGERIRYKPSLTINITPPHQAVVEEPNPTPALVTTASSITDPYPQTPESRLVFEPDIVTKTTDESPVTGGSAGRSLSKRFSFSNMSTAFKRKSSLPNLPWVASEAPDVPAVPAEYRKRASAAVEGGGVMPYAGSGPLVLPQLSDSPVDVEPERGLGGHSADGGVEAVDPAWKLGIGTLPEDNVVKENSRDIERASHTSEALAMPTDLVRAGDGAVNQDGAAKEGRTILTVDSMAGNPRPAELLYGGDTQPGPSGISEDKSNSTAERDPGKVADVDTEPGIDRAHSPDLDTDIDADVDPDSSSILHAHVLHVAPTTPRREGFSLEEFLGMVPVPPGRVAVVAQGVQVTMQKSQERRSVEGQVVGSIVMALGTDARSGPKEVGQAGHSSSPVLEALEEEPAKIRKRKSTSTSLESISVDSSSSTEAERNVPFETPSAVGSSPFPLVESDPHALPQRDSAVEGGLDSHLSGSESPPAERRRTLSLSRSITKLPSSDMLRRWSKSFRSGHSHSASIVSGRVSVEVEDVRLGEQGDVAIPEEMGGMLGREVMLETLRFDELGLDFGSEDQVEGR